MHIDFPGANTPAAWNQNKHVKFNPKQLYSQPPVQMTIVHCLEAFAGKIWDWWRARGVKEEEEEEVGAWWMVSIIVVEVGVMICVCCMLGVGDAGGMEWPQS